MKKNHLIIRRGIWHCNEKMNLHNSGYPFLCTSRNQRKIDDVSEVNSIEKRKCTTTTTTTKTRNNSKMRMMDEYHKKVKKESRRIFFPVIIIFVSVQYLITFGGGGLYQYLPQQNNIIISNLHHHHQHHNHHQDVFTTKNNNNNDKANNNKNNSITTTTIATRTRTPATTNSNTTATTTLPTILLADATPKAGTSTLAQWLFSPYSKNRGVCQAKTFPGESTYFSKGEVHFFDNKERYGQGLKFYESRYSHCLLDEEEEKEEFDSDGGKRKRGRRRVRNQNGTILSMDATPSNILHPERVFDTYREAGQLDTLRIIFSLREPISRDISRYNHIASLQLKQKQKQQQNSNNNNNNNNNNKPTTMEPIYRTYEEYAKQVAIPGLRIGTSHNVQFFLYEKYLKKWFELFRRDQILLLSFDEVLKNPAMARWRVEAFLGKSFPVGKNWDNDRNSNNNNKNNNNNKQNKQNNTTKKNKNKKKKKSNSSYEDEGKESYPKCAIQKKLSHLLFMYNERLYYLLESTGNDRPTMEQYPFPKFELGPCDK